EKTLPIGARMRDITPGDVDRFLQRDDLSVPSIRNYHRHLRAFFNWALKQAYTDQLPFSEETIEWLQQLRSDPLPSHYTQEAVLALFEAAARYAESPQTQRYANPYWISDFIRALAYLGARPNEVAHIRWSDVDLAKGFVTISKTKNRSERRVPIPEPLRARLREMQASSPDQLVFRS